MSKHKKVAAPGEPELDLTTIPRISAKNAAFGTVPMLAQVTDFTDISNVVKAVTSLVDPSEAVDGDLVQLIRPQEGYIEGHFYAFSKAENAWIDVSSKVQQIGQYANGYYLLCGNRLLMFWADPPGLKGNAWKKTQIFLRDFGYREEYPDGQMLLVESDKRNQYAETAFGISITVDTEKLGDYRVVSRVTFEDGSTTETDLRPFHSNESAILNQQSDWEEHERNKLGFIRNKPPLIRRVVVETDPNDNTKTVLAIYADDEASLYRYNEQGEKVPKFTIDETGHLWMEFSETEHDGEDSWEDPGMPLHLTRRKLDERYLKIFDVDLTCTNLGFLKRADVLDMISPRPDIEVNFTELDETWNQIETTAKINQIITVCKHKRIFSDPIEELPETWNGEDVRNKINDLANIFNRDALSMEAIELLNDSYTAQMCTDKINEIIRKLNERYVLKITALNLDDNATRLGFVKRTDIPEWVFDSNVLETKIAGYDFATNAQLQTLSEQKVDKEVFTAELAKLVHKPAVTIAEATEAIVSDPATLSALLNKIIQVINN